MLYKYKILNILLLLLLLLLSCYCYYYYYYYHYYYYYYYYLRNRKHVPCFYRVIQNMTGSLGEQDMCGNRSRTENMFCISFRRHRDEKKGHNLLTLIIKL